MQLTQLTVGGQDVVAALEVGSLEITDQLDGRDTCRFRLLATPPIPWQVGQAVAIAFDGTLRFGGTIDRLELRPYAGRLDRVRVEIEAVDYAQLADRRLAVKVYTDQPLRTIVEDLVTSYLAAEGVTLDPQCPTGPTLEHVVANYDPVSTVLTRLCEQTGYVWLIDPQRVLRLLARATWSAPESLTPTSGPDLVDTFRVRALRDQYRNIQYLRGGLAETDTEQVETFRGDGQRRTFTVALPLAQRAPTVRVNGVLQTVGIRQVDTGRSWYWEPESPQLSQDPSGAVLTTSDTLEVRYYGQYPLVSVARETASLLQRQLVEGGSGRYEQLEVNEEITTTALGRDRVQGLLRQYGQIQQEVTWTTVRGGWLAGQLVTIDRPAYGCTGSYLVAEVQIRHRVGQQWETTIRAVGGDAVLNWTAWWAELLRQARPRRTQEVVQPVESVTEPVPVPETATTTARSLIQLDGAWIGESADGELWRDQQLTRYWPGHVQTPSEALLVQAAARNLGGGNYGGCAVPMPTDLQTGVEWELRLLVRGTAGSTWAASWQSGAGDQNALSFTFTVLATWGWVRNQATLDANKPVLYVFSLTPSARLECLAIELIRHTDALETRAVSLQSVNWYGWPEATWTRGWTRPEGQTPWGTPPIVITAGRRLNADGALGGAQLTVAPRTVPGRSLRYTIVYQTRPPHVPWRISVYTPYWATVAVLSASPAWTTVVTTVTLPDHYTTRLRVFPDTAGPENADAQLALAALRVEDATLTRGSLVEGASVGLAEVAAA